MTSLATFALRHPTAGLAENGDPAVSSLTRSVAALLARQHEEGWWKGELETNVTMDAEDLLLRQFLGIRTEEQTAASARWIRSRQREDGTWATYFGGPPDLSTTIEAYVALRLAGDPVDAPHMHQAAAFVRRAGGIAASRVFTRIWLALFGQWPWEDLPVLPPELMLLPRWIPLNIYDFGCWARQTVVALTVISGHRPIRPLTIDLDELRGEPTAPTRRRPLTTWAGRFELLDRALHAYERRPLGVLRRFSLGAAERWILQRQEADGSWGGIQPPWVYSLMALHVQGYALDHPVMRSGLAGLDGFTIEDEAGRRVEACQSPVWDTALAVQALADGGVPPDDPALRHAAQWLVGQEITVPGDWSVQRPNLAPGGWAFEFANDSYPDIDDTAEVVLALRRVAQPDHGSVARAVDWTEGMQCRDGGWAAFDVDNTQVLCRELPFCDFGELIDPPSADVTAMSSRCCRSWDGAVPARNGESPGCSRPRSPTARGSDVGGPTTPTGPVPRCRLWSRPVWPPTIRPCVGRWTGSRPNRTLTAGGARICVRTTMPRHGAADPPRPARRRGCSWRCWRPASAARSPNVPSPSWSTPSGPTARGTTPGSPVPGSRGTSTSTTTSIT